MSDDKLVSNKLIPIYIFDCLQKYSDECHHLTAEKIIEILSEKGIKLERKTIYKTIKILTEYGLDINNSRIPERGYYIDHRDFEVAEIRLLVDAVLTAPFITSKKTKELIDKLSSLLSTYQAEKIYTQMYYDKRIKFHNEEIYYVIDTINEAISSNKKISFTYNHKILKGNKICLDEGKQFSVSPYALIWSNDRYYLAGSNDKFDDITNYRLDRIKKIQILDDNRRPVNEVSPFVDNFDTDSYIKKNINMFPGKSSTITLECNDSMLDVIIDRFGIDCKFIHSDNKNSFKVTANVYVSKGLEDWLVQHAQDVFICSPVSLRNNVKNIIKNMYDTYFL